MRCLPAFLIAAVWIQAAPLPQGVRFLPGPVNGVLIGDKLLVYGDSGTRVKSPAHVLFTHARRDVVWAGARLVANGAAAVVPERERALFEDPSAFWKTYESARFHDYSQVNTKVLREPVRVTRTVKGGEVLVLNGVRIEVVDTPGYTRGAVSYIVEAGGKRIACTGDLIHSDGRLLDLSSLQDAIPESKTRGYHGYAARAGDLIESLRRVLALKPDFIVPARGELIENPREAVERLIARLQALMASHFATDALRWYWGEESLRIRSRKALDSRPVDSMPMAEQRPLPAWARPIGNSRLLLSETGAALLVDAGFKRLPATLDELKAEGKLKSVEGIWITHYHDDHTDIAQELSTRFNCPVWYAPVMADVMARPGSYRLPCLTANPVTSGKPLAGGTKFRWHEFQITAFTFPGQTLYHGGLLVERDGGESLFFVGDSFTPSGIDDYCLQNRNFTGEDQGFLYCLRVLKGLKPDVWLVNQHVEPTFRFSAEQFGRMEQELRKRAELIKHLSPWPGADYAIDESWATMYPYAQEAGEGERIPLEVRITSHSPGSETFQITWNLPEGWKVLSADRQLTVKPGGEGFAKALIEGQGEGLHVITANIHFAGRELREWTEGLVRIRKAGRTQ